MRTALAPTGIFILSSCVNFLANSCRIGSIEIRANPEQPIVRDPSQPRTLLFAAHIEPRRAI
jgi:hypothetical protein